MHLIIANQVRDDITNIYNYIARNSLKYANETVNNIYSRIAELENFPYLGRYVPELSDKQYRELLYKNYRIVYSVSEKTNSVNIHFVIHSKQDFNELLKKYVIKK